MAAWIRLLLLTGFLCLWPTPAVPQTMDLSKLAKQIAELLERESRREELEWKKHDPILVSDLLSAAGDPTELGRWLGDELTAALRTATREFRVIDRAEVESELARQKLLTHSLLVRSDWEALASFFGAVAVVTGTVEQRGDLLDLRVYLRAIRKRVDFGALAYSMAAPVGAREKLDLPRLGYEPRTNIPEIRTAAFESETCRSVARAGVGGVRYPGCADCRDPKFSEPARKARYQGSLEFIVRVNPQGKADDVLVVKGLPFGLTEEGIAAVRQWKFKPAQGPNGRPVSVCVPVEITFRLL